MQRRPVLIWLTLGLGLIGALTACGSGGDQEKKPATQVAVKVNKEEISVHQVNNQLARLGNVPEASRVAAKKQIVDGLIDQQLMIQQAVEKKLDRDPEVLRALEQSRHQILSQAYVQKSIAANLKPSDDEIKAYYKANPALFSERRLYRLQELATNMPVDQLDDLRGQIAKAKSLQEVAGWLKGKGFDVAGNAAVRAAEQLPMNSLAQLAALKDGEMSVFVDDGRITVVHLAQSQSQPLTEVEAAKFIEQYLFNIKRDQATRSELKRLREIAKIEFVGDFAGLAAAPTGDATAAAGADQTAPKADDKGVDKGLKGLR